MPASLIVALDYPDCSHALKMAARLKESLDWVKVGLELFISAGPEIIGRLKEMGFKIFLDLKIYDIPHTAEKAAQAMARHGVEMFTVHCQGGRRMCEGVVQTLQTFAKPPLVIGVTALTSFGEGEMPGISIQLPAYALELAGFASIWKLDGVVCSGKEAASIKKFYPQLKCICPGIRPVSIMADDQSRILTPAAAIQAGADYLVIGRPITHSPDPVRALNEIQAEIASAL